MKSNFILVIYFLFILNGYIEYKFMIKIVIPHPERVYGMCNCRVACSLLAQLVVRVLPTSISVPLGCGFELSWRRKKRVVGTFRNST